ncbi:hypothetical protein [Ureibacillus sp. GCM10028918]|uniref:hypothetical protein n=1 Tax=Ureibacillus sp. GCM10028918 TaxID=3273429 RepID=UPI00361FA2A7
MLQISRKLFALPINQVYFKESKCDSRFDPKIICYTHVLKPSRKLQGQKTLHIDLRQDETTLNYKMSDKVIPLLDDMQDEDWKISRWDHPTDKDIEAYQQFYNLNAKQKDIRKLDKYDVQTLKLLRDQGGLLITKIENEQKAFISYGIYAVGEEMVMALYNDGQGLINDKFEQSVNYFLCLENIKYFGEQGYRIYDFGDIKDLTILEQLNEHFGGKLVTVFSGYITKSPFSQMLLQLNLKGLKKRLSY